jgi:hypothetical protein
MVTSPASSPTCRAQRSGFEPSERARSFPGRSPAWSLLDPAVGIAVAIDDWSAFGTGSMVIATRSPSCTSSALRTGLFTGNTNDSDA